MYSPHTKDGYTQTTSKSNSLGAPGQKKKGKSTEELDGWNKRDYERERSISWKMA